MVRQLIASGLVMLGVGVCLTCFAGPAWGVAETTVVLTFDDTVNDTDDGAAEQSDTIEDDIAVIAKGTTANPAAGVLTDGDASVGESTCTNVNVSNPEATSWLGANLDCDVPATFFVNWPRIGETSRGFLSERDIQEMDRAGLEIGDHTAGHLRLPAIEAGSSGQTAEANEQRRQVCWDRQQVSAIPKINAVGEPLSTTLNVYSLAYPFGAYRWPPTTAADEPGLPSDSATLITNFGYLTQFVPVGGASNFGPAIGMNNQRQITRDLISRDRPIGQFPMDGVPANPVPPPGQNDPVSPVPVKATFDCGGFKSARITEGAGSASAVAEALDEAGLFAGTDRFAVRAVPSVRFVEDRLATDEHDPRIEPDTMPPRRFNDETSLATIAGRINQARKASPASGHNLVVLTFHHICPRNGDDPGNWSNVGTRLNCNANGFDYKDFRALVNWLREERKRTQAGVFPNHIEIKSLHEVMDVDPATGLVNNNERMVGTSYETRPTVTRAFVEPNWVSGVVNPEQDNDANRDYLPDCYQATADPNVIFASQGATPVVFAGRADVDNGGAGTSRWFSWVRAKDGSALNRYFTRQDLGACALAARENNVYRISFQYRLPPTAARDCPYRPNLNPQGQLVTFGAPGCANGPGALAALFGSAVVEPDPPGGEGLAVPIGYPADSPGGEIGAAADLLPWETGQEQSEETSGTPTVHASSVFANAAVETPGGASFRLTWATRQKNKTYIRTGSSSPARAEYWRPFRDRVTGETNAKRTTFADLNSDTSEIDPPTPSWQLARTTIHLNETVSPSDSTIVPVDALSFGLQIDRGLTTGLVELDVDSFSFCRLPVGASYTIADGTFASVTASVPEQFPAATGGNGNPIPYTYVNVDTPVCA